MQINPLVRGELPRSAREIMNRVNEISFNSSLVKELRAIGLMQRVAEAKGIDLGVYTHTYLHLIHTDLEVKDLVASSKLNAEWSYLRLLFDLGRKWADDWLAENFDAIGQHSTLDLDMLEGDGRLPPAGSWQPRPRPSERVGGERSDERVLAGRCTCSHCCSLSGCAPRGRLTVDPDAADGRLRRDHLLCASSRKPAATGVDYLRERPGRA